MKWLRGKFSNLSMAMGLLLVLAAVILLASQISNISSDALLSLISAIIGGLIATSSQVWVSSLDRQNELRLAAIDKRLAAHQEAYSLWRKLLFNAANQETIGDIVMECQTWWENNCLYLEPNAREAFYNAVISAGSHLDYLHARDTESIKRNLERIKNAGKAIEAAVYLPTIGDLEEKVLEKQQSTKNKA